MSTLRRRIEVARQTLLWLAVATAIFGSGLRSVTLSNNLGAIDPGTVALVTSATTFLGFVITTVIALRKERRESARADAELEKVRLENEKLRAELESRKDEPARRRVKRPL
ncbi:hypothetical protein IAG25_33085 [Caballeronia sp. EK]|uniref:hypothetical protein n=1 Tax=Caballeronia sp. EK TaxID=2767469 RepID=UPI001654DDEA|nr:hypothetical protein [Caballeronia sp. EK]MBC8641662.1 hypothetical protein [Caballeronia sp. EK]